VANTVVKLLNNPPSTCDYNNKRLSSPFICSALQIMEIIGSNIPTFGFFFVNYLLNALLVGSIMSLLRVWSLLVWLYMKWRGTYSEESREEYLKHNLSTFYLGVRFSSHLSFLTIAFTYLPLLPFMSLTGFLYFLMWYISDKYNLVCVYRQKYSHGGRLTSTCLSLIFTALILSQLLLTTVLLVKQAFSMVVLLILIIGLTWWAFSTFRKKFGPLAENLSLEALSEIEELPLEYTETFKDSYLENCFKKKDLISKLCQNTEKDKNDLENPPLDLSSEHLDIE